MNPFSSTPAPIVPQARPTDAPSMQPDHAAPAPDRLRWWQEPLLHFVLAGAVLFAADHLLQAQRDDPLRIVISREVDSEARQLFKASRGREPDAAELKALRQVWLDNEVLYREGLALQVDKGDSTIRERVIFKALNVVGAALKPPPADDSVLRRWFEQRRNRYDDPQRLDFQEAVLAGEATESAVRAFVAQLNSGVSGDTKAGLRVFKGRPQDNLVHSYGAEFAKALAAAAAGGDWLALPTRDGWRAVRLEALTPARPASFEALRGMVLQDWTDATMADQRSAAVRALAQKYRVEIEAAQP